MPETHMQETGMQETHMPETRMQETGMQETHMLESLQHSLTFLSMTTPYVYPQFSASL